MKLLLLGFCIYVTLLVEIDSADGQQQLGGFGQISADNGDVKQKALSSLNSLTQKSDSKRPLRLIRVVSAHSKVVAGTMYNMTLLVCEKNSTNMEDNDIDYKFCRSCNLTIFSPVIPTDTNDVSNVACTEPSELVLSSSLANNNGPPAGVKNDATRSVFGFYNIAVMSISVIMTCFSTTLNV